MRHKNIVMGILISKTLTVGSNITVPEGALVLPEVTILIPILYCELENPLLPLSPSNQITQKYRRVIRYILLSYESVNSWKNSDGKDRIFTKEIPAGWAREITDQEYSALVANGAMAEKWLADYLNEILGGEYCEVINALAN